ncbi:hypothetical protein P3G55_08300 [Leptospira sp. 96542]|nr:hypothetical protein [Leptospira sp. 96542]
MFAVRFSKFFFILIFFSCISRTFILQKGTPEAGEESIKIRYFAALGLIPLYRKLDRKDVCEDSEIYSITIQICIPCQIICKQTFTLFCPQTVGVRCVKSNEKKNI